MQVHFRLLTDCHSMLTCSCFLLVQEGRRGFQELILFVQVGNLVGKSSTLAVEALHIHSQAMGGVVHGVGN